MRAMTLAGMAVVMLAGATWGAQTGALELVGTLKVMARSPEGQITTLVLTTNIGGMPAVREVTGDMKVLSQFVDKRVKVVARYQDKAKGTGKILVIEQIEAVK